MCETVVAVLRRAVAIADEEFGLIMFLPMALSRSPPPLRLS